MMDNPCYGCPDRCPDPNCHITCAAYKDWQAQHVERKAQIRKANDLYFALTEYVQQKNTKRLHKEGRHG